MSNSPLVSYTKLSPNNYGPRTHTIDRISPHCLVAQWNVVECGAWFVLPSTKASPNYCIAKDGAVGMYVEEGKRSICTSSSENDNRAVTIECASDSFSPWAMYPAVYNSLIKLCVDICKRNGKNKLVWIPDKTQALSYNQPSNEMLITVHRWFSAKACPGDWLYARLGSLATEVTRQLGGSSSSIDTTPAQQTVPTAETPAIEEELSSSTSARSDHEVKVYARSMPMAMTFKITPNESIDKNSWIKIKRTKSDTDYKVTVSKKITFTEKKTKTIRMYDIRFRNEVGLVLFEVPYGKSFTVTMDYRPGRL